MLSHTNGEEEGLGWEEEGSSHYRRRLLPRRLACAGVEVVSLAWPPLHVGGPLGGCCCYRVIFFCFFRFSRLLLGWCLVSLLSAPRPPPRCLSDLLLSLLFLPSPLLLLLLPLLQPFPHPPAPPGPLNHLRGRIVLVRAAVVDRCYLMLVLLVLLLVVVLLMVMLLVVLLLVMVVLLGAVLGDRSRFLFIRRPSR